MQKNLHFSGQLERTKIPSFDGEKSKFESFWAAFINIVDIANVSPEMKMLRLKEKLVGKAAKVVESLGYSAEEYEAAKEKLERKFGGERRKLQTYIDKLKHMKILRVGNSDELEEFADNLVDAVVKLRASGRHGDLEPNSTLYRDLLAKMPTSYLSRFHEWKKREYRDPNLESLKEWVVEQAEFLVQAMEDKAGLDLVEKKEKRDAKKDPPFPGKKKEWNNGGFSKDSVFVTNESGNEKLKNKCRVCGEDHDASRCEELKKRSVGDRWKTAKACGLCYRCLEANHRGNDCGSSKICRIDGCKETHHYLLHSKRKANKSKAETKQESEIGAQAKNGLTTEGGDDVRTHVTSLASKHKDEVLGFRTIPVIIMNPQTGQEKQVNALLATDCSHKCC